MAIFPQDWLLNFTSADVTKPLGDGRPWGDGTEMARRAKDGRPPWDTGCKVTPVIGGYRAMNEEMVDALVKLAVAAEASTDRAGTKGHVYIADWRFNCQRDLSAGNGNSAGTGWGPNAKMELTAIGLVLRLMQAGVVVRILVWLPLAIQAVIAEIQPHVDDHFYLAEIVKAENEKLGQKLNPTRPLGLVGLDARTADGAASGAHHQKMMVIRSPLGGDPAANPPGIHVAFCGGVDLAFTRRDSPNTLPYDSAKFLDGDWQSGINIPAPGQWPPDISASDTFKSVRDAPLPSHPSLSDLPAQDPPLTGLPIYGSSRQIWHDQHLVLKGPIVASLEWQFAERWIDSSRVFDLSNRTNLFGKQIIFSSADAFDSTKTPPAVVPLESPLPIPPISGATSTVQIWRTIPWRDSRTTDLFRRAEFTVMSGYEKAISTAAELIWIFDQYFWSLPLARLVNYRVGLTDKDPNNPDPAGTHKVCVIVILPPYADTQVDSIHRARRLCLQALTGGLNPLQRDRIAVYNLWRPDNLGKKANGRGIYVHAKTQTYDGSLLVCGSANMNRRSLNCDSELACAVLDPVVVTEHQKSLWKLLFGSLTAWPGVDLTSPGSGKAFLDAVKAAAGADTANLTPDPWDSPATSLTAKIDQGTTISSLPVVRTAGMTTPGTRVSLGEMTLTVASGSSATSLAVAPGQTAIDTYGLGALVTAIPSLPNQVPGPVAPPGPKFEVTYAAALDPTSLDSKVEQDVVDSDLAHPGKKLPPRPVRLDDIVNRIEEKPSEWRQQADILSSTPIHWPAVKYSDGTYTYVETAEWWKQLCSVFPCFHLLQWPDYDTIEDPVTINNQPYVVQLWKGYCPKFLGMEDFPGGVGAEVGIYQKIANKERPKSLPFLPAPLEKKILDSIAGLADNDLWWPVLDLGATIRSTLTNPYDNESIFFEAGPESNTYWLTKWMTTASYDQYKNAHPGRTPTFSTGYKLNYTITVNGKDYKPRTTPW